nr:sigma-70 factor domain-containing protein [Sneathiella glossodoripedis]
MSNVTLPTLSPEGGLSRYLQEIRKFPMLEADEEYMLAKAWKERGDSEAAHKMVTSICALWQKSPWVIADMVSPWANSLPRAMWV